MKSVVMDCHSIFRPVTDGAAAALSIAKQGDNEKLTHSMDPQIYQGKRVEYLLLQVWPIDMLPSIW